MNSSTEQLALSIDLDLVISSAKRNNYRIYLHSGYLHDSEISWDQSVSLPLDYPKALTVMDEFIKTYFDKFIKIQVCSSALVYRYDRNTLIHNPLERKDDN